MYFFLLIVTFIRVKNQWNHFLFCLFHFTFYLCRWYFVLEKKFHDRSYHIGQIRPTTPKVAGFVLEQMLASCPNIQLA